LEAKPGGVVQEYKEGENEFESIKNSLQGGMKAYMNESAPKEYAGSGYTASAKKYLESIGVNDDEPDNRLPLVSLKK